MFRTNNPALRSDVFAKPATWDSFMGSQAVAPAAARPNTMTVAGTARATGVLLLLCIVAAVGAWTLIDKNPAMLSPSLWGGMLIGLGLSLVIVFKPQSSPYIAPVYAIAEGVFVGAISALYASLSVQRGWSTLTGTGIVFQSALLTFGIAAALLVVYATGLYRPGRLFRTGVIAATGGVCLFFVGTMLLSLFGINFPSLWSSGPLGIGIAAFIVVLASANLVLDFDLVAVGARNGAPRYFEWYGGFAILVTLVWLYISLLRLLALLQDRR
ncbi:MAG: Bax inhibitor-1/YccA family protein [Phycisphaeraceae bacterium]|nr:Bax inhibitor-1/YccA family protein [Phycisphaeraceae bacterium]